MRTALTREKKGQYLYPVQKMKITNTADCVGYFVHNGVNVWQAEDNQKYSPKKNLRTMCLSI